GLAKSCQSHFKEWRQLPQEKYKDKFVISRYVVFMKQGIFLAAALISSGLLLLNFTQAQSMDRKLPSEITVRFADENGKPTERQQVPSIVKTDEEWKAELSPDAYRILRAHATERAHCG